MAVDGDAVHGERTEEPGASGVASGDGREARQDEGLDALEAEVAAALVGTATEVRLIHLHARPAVLLGAVHTQAPTDGAAELVRLVELGAARGYLVYPVRLSRAGLERLRDAAAPAASERLHESAGFPEAWAEPLTPGPCGPEARPRLSRIIQRNASALEQLEASQLPLHLCMSAAADVMGESLAILFAACEQPWVEDASLLERFDRHVAGPTRFPRAVVRTYLELRGAAALGRMEHLELAPSLPLDQVDFRAAREFLSRLEQWVVERSSPPRARRRRTRWLRAVAWSPLAAVLAGAIVYGGRRWPEAPLESPPPETSRGGIRGEYFAGTGFETKVLSRVDDRIRLSGRKKVAPEVPADEFSVRWDGKLYFAADGRYALCTESDDGSRVYFNGRKLIDDWEVHAATRTCEIVRVGAGW